MSGCRKKECRRISVWPTRTRVLAQAAAHGRRAQPCDQRSIDTHHTSTDRGSHAQRWASSQADRGLRKCAATHLQAVSRNGRRQPRYGAGGCARVSFDAGGAARAEPPWRLSSWKSSRSPRDCEGSSLGLECSDSQRLITTNVPRLSRVLEQMCRKAVAKRKCQAHEPSCASQRTSDLASRTFLLDTSPERTLRSQRLSPAGLDSGKQPSCRVRAA